jgi:hypothetical protein
MRSYRCARMCFFLTVVYNGGRSLNQKLIN